MKFYLYDETTKEYIGDQIGYIDPLETKLKGENVYLIPPYSTDIEPNLSELKDNEIFVFNGSKWEIQKEFFVGKVVKDQSEKVIKFCNDNGYILEQVENGFKICAPAEKSLSELKSEKLAELTSITSKFDNQLVNTDMIIKSSLGFKVNADLRSQNNLRGLIAVGVEPVNFVTADNSVKSLSLAELNTLLNECAINGQSLYLQKWAYKTQIENAQTKEELEAIEFKFTMRDFSNE